MSKESLVALLFVGFLFVFFFWHWVIQIFHWLKGSRRSYYFGVNQRVIDSPESFRGSIRPVIEVNRGLFRRRSAIYASDPRHWQVAGVSVGRDGTNWVKLQERRGLVLGRALELINTYPSLQAMLDRIAELEAELKSRPTQLELQAAKDNLFLANERREEWSSGISAVSLVIMTDKQRYRSPASEHIAGCLKAITDWASSIGEPFPPADKILLWKKLFPPLSVRR